jgi:hypothetical protein
MPERRQQRLILVYGRNSREYRLVIGDCVICLGPKIEFSRGCAIAFVLALTSAVLGQDAIPISRTNRSILSRSRKCKSSSRAGLAQASRSADTLIELDELKVFAHLKSDGVSSNTC